MSLLGCSAALTLGYYGLLHRRRFRDEVASVRGGARTSRKGGAGTTGGSGRAGRRSKGGRKELVASSDPDEGDGRPVALRDTALDVEADGEGKNEEILGDEEYDEGESDEEGEEGDEEFEEEAGGKQRMQSNGADAAH